MSTDILSRYPDLRDKPQAMALFVRYLRSQNKHADAVAMARAAVAARPADMWIRDEVRYALSVGVDPFHFPMLNDVARNRAYVGAIERAVRPGMTVLEIGAGSGLLAMAAARAGATVTTCEENPTIAATAAAIVEANGLSDRVCVVGKRSTALCIPDDLAEPADLVIHEIFGHMLFNEGVTLALTDARDRLLRPDAPSVPPRAAVRCALARSDRPSTHTDVTEVEGFDLSLFNLLGRPNKHHVPPNSRQMTCCSAAVSTMNMDYDAPPPFGPSHETVELVSTGGRVDGVAQWLRLDFGSEVLENDPFTAQVPSGWAVPFIGFPEPIATEPGQRIKIEVRHRRNRLFINLLT